MIDRHRLEEAFWTRHANPWSGLSRLLSTPVLMYAIYARKRRLLAAVLAFLVVNPVLFPQRESDDWMARGVRAERFWLAHGPRWSLPNLLNVLNVPVSLYAVYAAIRRRPLGTVLGTAGLMALKLVFIQKAIAFHEANRGRLPEP